MKNEINSVEIERVNKVKQLIENIKNKKSKFLFCVPNSQNPVSSVYEIYFHATVVKNMGYNVKVLTEQGDYIIPTWIEEELTNVEHMPMSDPKLSVGAEDIMVIPDVFSNVMEHTKNLPCLRIGLLQSVDYMMNALIPGTDWSTFGIRDIITISPNIVEWVNIFLGRDRFNIKQYDLGIPDYFEKSNKPQKPIISIVGRNSNEISKFVKLFYAKNPHYSWVSFDPMLTKSKPPQQMRRVDFAKRLQNNFAAIWIDRISSFGTFPLECMKSGVIPICMKPDILPDYIIERDENGNSVKIKEGAGIWTDNFYDLPVLAADVLVKYLDDNINDELYDDMRKVVAPYNQTNSQKQLVDIYQSYINERITLFEQALMPITENE